MFFQWIENIQNRLQKNFNISITIHPNEFKFEVNHFLNQYYNIYQYKEYQRYLVQKSQKIDRIDVELPYSELQFSIKILRIKFIKLKNNQFSNLKILLTKV